MKKSSLIYICLFLLSIITLSANAGLVELGSGDSFGYDSSNNLDPVAETKDGALVQFGAIDRGLGSGGNPSGFNSCTPPKILSTPIPGTNLYKECICPAEYKTIDTTIYVGVGDECDGKYKDYACIDGKPLQADGSCSCDDGYYWDGSTCIICPAGSKCADDIKDLCDEISSDYQDAQGQSVCKTCPDGYEVSADRTQCTACLAGEYSTGGAPCDPCASGQCSVAAATQCFARGVMCPSVNSAVETLPDGACKYTTESKVFNKQPGESCSGTASGTCYVVEDACELGEICENKGTEGVCEYYGKMVFTVPVTAASPSASAYVYPRSNDVSSMSFNVDCGNGTKGVYVNDIKRGNTYKCSFDAPGDYKVTATGRPQNIQFEAVEGSELLELSLKSLVRNSEHVTGYSALYGISDKNLSGLIPDLSKLVNFVVGDKLFAETSVTGFAPDFDWPKNLRDANSMFDGVEGLTGNVPSMANIETDFSAVEMFNETDIVGFAKDFKWPKNLESIGFGYTHKLTDNVPSMANIETESFDANYMFFNSAITGFADDFDWPKNLSNALSMFSKTFNLSVVPSMANIKTEINASYMFSNSAITSFADDFDWPKNLTNAEAMFSKTFNLSVVPSMANIETELNASWMFNESGVTSFADDFDWPKNLTNAKSMFSGIESLTGDVPSMANIESELNAYRMFSYCKDLSCVNKAWTNLTGFADDFAWPKNLISAEKMFEGSRSLTAKVPTMANIETEVMAPQMFERSAITGFADDFDWPKNLTNANNMFYLAENLTGKIPSMENIETTFNTSSMFFGTSVTGLAPGFQLPPNLTYTHASTLLWGIKNKANFTGTCPNPTVNITQAQLKKIFADTKVDCDVVVPQTIVEQCIEQGFDYVYNNTQCMDQAEICYALGLDTDGMDFEIYNGECTNYQAADEFCWHEIRDYPDDYEGYDEDSRHDNCKQIFTQDIMWLVDEHHVDYCEYYSHCY